MNKRFRTHAHDALTKIVFGAKTDWRVPGKSLDGSADVVDDFHLLMKADIAARDVLAQLQKDMNGIGVYFF